MEKGSYLENVRNQYENYPYPARDPEDEKGLVFSSKSSSLDAINFFCFEGKRDFSKPFRVLVPGGGTGDCTTYMAEQLRDTPAEIVYLDMSTASMAIAKERAKVRGLTNITWIHDSILNIPKLDLGKFDYISCTGVLHHMSDPQAGLDALKSVLHPDGAMFLLLYAQYGRTGIYQMQDLLRRIHVNEPDPEKKIANTKKILKSLPDGNWYNFNAAFCAYELKTDIGLYDLLLHPQDRAYTVPELYDYVEKSGLIIQKHLNPDHGLGDMVFRPETFFRDPEILATVKKLSFPEQAAICELMFGQMDKQCCYVAHKPIPMPAITNLELIPTLAVSISRDRDIQYLSNLFLGDAPSVRVNQFISINRTPHMADIFRAIDGKRTARQIIALAHKKSASGASLEQVEAEYKSIAMILNSIYLLYVRDVSVPAYPTVKEMEMRMHKLYGKKQCMKILEAYHAKNYL